MLCSASTAVQEAVVAMRLRTMAPTEQQGEKDAQMAPDAASEQEKEERDQIAPSSSRAKQGEQDAETALAPSQEEQDEQDAEIAPTAGASEKQQETEARDQMAPAASKKKKEEVAKIDEVLSLLEPLPAKLTVLLKAAGPRRVRDPPERRALEFMKMELADIVDSLNSMRPPLLLLDDSRVGVGLKMDWLSRLLLFARDAHSLVKQVADSQRHTMLRRAARFFRRSNKVLMYMMEESFRVAECACKYRCLVLASGSGRGSGSSDHALPTCPGPDLPLFGIGRPTKKILRWLTPGEETEKLRIMAIVGPAGMGKTTLAMELHRLLQCQASRGHNSFQCSVVVHVSNSTCRMELLLRDILSGISDCTAPALPSDQSSSNTVVELLVHRVQEYLHDKRYFILIDDLWHRGDWEAIKGAFPNNNLGGRLLITTRVESIAWSCCSDSDALVHQMKPLNHMDSERLLLAKAFVTVDGYPSESMKPFCDGILMACQGIPLFITGMASWLKEQFRQQQHEEEEDHQRFAIDSVERLSQLPERFEQELSSAFDDLPSELSTIILCMSMFPYLCSFEKDHLVLKWLSECHTSSREYFVIDKLKRDGKEYFSQLADRNVISSVAANHKPGWIEAEACQWHVNQLMLQFLASKSAKIGFAFTSTTLNLVEATTATGNGKVTRMPRRLALHHPDPLLPSVIQTMDLLRTRWLTVSGAVSGIPLDRFVNLVVLDLEGWDYLNYEGLEHICGAMFVLEYLSIRKTQVSKLPGEVKELKNLMILDVSCTKISVLPFEVSELKRLYHLDLRRTGIRQLGEEIVGLQSTLHTLLVGDEGTINSIEEATWVPHDIKHFHALHTLATIDLTRHPESFVRALGDLGNLKVLAVTWSFHQCNDRAYREALLSSIRELQRLESLTIHCGLGCSMDFLGALSHKIALDNEMPDKYKLWTLEKFRVTAGRFACVPQWIDHGLEFLSYVQITVCRLGTDDLKRLGELLQLQCLILGLDFIPEEAIVIEGAWFRELRRFSVDCQMPWLTFRTGAMRKLRYLQLKLCTCPASSQDGVPSGIGSLQSLSELALCYDPWYINSPNVKATVEAVRKEVAAHPNQIDLLINGHQDYNVQAGDEEETESEWHRP